MPQIQTAEPGKVLPFIRPTMRPLRPAAASPDGRGAILLFTGVRYERPVEAASTSLDAEAGRLQG